MGGCCEPRGYGDLFTERYSRHLAKRYRKRGLDKTARRIVAFLTDRGIDGATVLELGGGVGDIQLELLRRGAARATNLELVDSYDEDARALAAEAGLADRITRRQVDLALTPDLVEPHDIVVLHRVVCCYRDHQRLLAAAADHATRLLVFSHPPRNLVSRLVFATENLLFRLRRTAFRTYLHDPVALTAAAERGSLETRYLSNALTWHIVGLERPT
ncbi:MAG TPA: class I SAM-dependent methyltransferase [Nocardioidaceae bacterium]|jgi:magnesium-protoporphyrin O-methyltransferase